LVNVYNLLHFNFLERKYVFLFLLSLLLSTVHQRRDREQYIVLQANQCWPNRLAAFTRNNRNRVGNRAQLSFLLQCETHLEANSEAAQRFIEDMELSVVNQDHVQAFPSQEG